VVGKSERKRHLGRPTCRWEDTIKMDLNLIVCEGVDLVQLAQKRVRWLAAVNMIMNLQIP
jgi:hypothetical protein